VIRTLIVDDEPLARDALRLRVTGEPDLELVGESASGRQAIQAIREMTPDLVFLDIRMPDLSGFDVLARLDAAVMPHVVFVTAYDEYALKAFDVHALAYLLKPFDDLRFADAMAHVRQFFDTRAASAPLDLPALLADVRAALSNRTPVPDAPDDARAGAPLGGPLTRLVVKSGSRSRIVPTTDIDWIEADGNYVRLHCGAETHLVSRTMTELADALDARQFVRIHRSAIVSVARIRELRTDDYRDYTVILRDGQRLRLSRSYRQALEDALGDRI
jgi:two-component system LytT family response regulator